MKNSREIFLFGAGAIIDWGGPPTSELTKLVLESGFNIKNNETKITKYIYDRLISCGYTEDEINFETIINVIEELIIFYSEFNNETTSPSISRAFLQENNINDILNYSIDGNKRKHGYKILIPKNSNYPFSKHAYNNENPDSFFLQHLISSLIDKINSRISKYSYHTATHSVINTNSENSLLFKKWISTISEKSIIRMYTLNYDRVFKILLNDIDIECFEGFNITETVDDIYGVRADVLKIVNDFNVNVHYNLHGSAYWKVKALNKYQILNPEIQFKGSPNLPSSDSNFANIQMEKGKLVYLTNIITGYQKAQKTILTPIKQMHYALDKDCCNANKIYIVGYSFGDEHINESIKTSLRYNKDVQIEIIEPNFIKNKIEEKLYLSVFQYIENKPFKRNNISENIYSYFKNQIIVYTLNFGEYLKIKGNS